MKKSAIATGALCMMAAPAAAQGFYADVGVQGYNVDGGGAYDDEIAGSVTGHVGYDLGDFLGVEAEGSYGVLDASAGGADFGFNYIYGGFGRFNFPVGRSLRVFGRAGYATSEFEASGDVGGGQFSITETYSGFAYGAGAEMWFGDGGGLGLRADYTRYSLDDAEFDAFMLGLSFKL